MYLVGADPCVCPCIPRLLLFSPQPLSYNTSMLTDQSAIHNPQSAIVASILSADFARLGEQVREAEQAGAGRIQVDVMDGHFVPNITVGPLVLKAIRPYFSRTIEAHLMIERPELYIPEFA